MIRASFTAALLACASPAFAQHEGHAGHDMAPPEESATPAEAPPAHQGHDMPEAEMPPTDHSMHGGQGDSDSREGPEGHGMAMPKEGSAIPQAPPPPEAFAGPEHAADAVTAPGRMAASRAALKQEMGRMTWATMRIDRLEAQSGKGGDTWLWDADLAYGSDRDKLWLKSEGHSELSFSSFKEGEVQALWSHAIGPWFDVQAGVRQEWRNAGPQRTQLALGLQGLAPYFFEVDVAAFLSTEGEVTARIEAEYDQRITQRLILQPRVEAMLSAQHIPELGLGAGLISVEAGARLRYEIMREFAPYLGIEWQKSFGRTADFARSAGEVTDRTMLVVGLRFWF